MESFDDIINGQQPVLVDAFATWCAPCKAMAPVLEELAHELTGRARVLKVDVDRNLMFAQRYQVRGVPTFLLFKHGQVVWRQSGAMPAGQLTAAVERHL